MIKICSLTKWQWTILNVHWTIAEQLLNNEWKKYFEVFSRTKKKKIVQWTFIVIWSMNNFDFCLKVLINRCFFFRTLSSKNVFNELKVQKKNTPIFFLKNLCMFYNLFNERSMNSQTCSLNVHWTVTVNERSMNIVQWTFFDWFLTGFWLIFDCSLTVHWAVTVNEHSVNNVHWMFIDGQNCSNDVQWT